MSAHSLRRVAALAAAIPLLSGCFSYVAAEPAGVRPGEEVRVYLTRGAVLDLEEAIPTRGSSERSGPVKL